MNNLDEIVDRAIEYTNLTLQRMPSYHAAAVAGLRNLRNALAAKNPDDEAIRKLDDYLDSLYRSQPGEGV